MRPSARHKAPPPVTYKQTIASQSFMAKKPLIQLPPVSHQTPGAPRDTVDEDPQTAVRHRPIPVALRSGGRPPLITIHSQSAAHGTRVHRMAGTGPPLCAHRPPLGVTIRIVGEQPPAPSVRLHRHRHSPLPSVGGPLFFLGTGFWASYLWERMCPAQMSVVKYSAHTARMSRGAQTHCSCAVGM